MSTPETPTPHPCAVPPLDSNPVGALWQCPTCNQTWGVFTGRNLDQDRRYKHWLGTTPDGEKIGNWFNGKIIYPAHPERVWAD
ncbi:hypothetical protein [Leifsonia sp. Leaf264]|uniref:hypothetical protein n=1 Tax=Leifsonia sp. Leaf264 TaxID=1736314 RepID=UPI000A927CF9|nr:hypothetical protein [Leifsonia sp. Leaf264]